MTGGGAAGLPTCARCGAPIVHGCNVGLCSLACELKLEAEHAAAHGGQVPDGCNVDDCAAVGPCPDCGRTLFHADDCPRRPVAEAGA